MFFFSKYRITWAIIIVILAGGAVWYFSRSKPPQYETATAIRGDLVQVVNVTGRVKPAKNVDLAFEKGGRIAAVDADVGDRVSAGKAIVSLENGDIASQLKAEEAKLKELKAGSRPEDISVEKVKIANAGFYLKDAENNVADKINDAFTKSDDAIRNKVDQFINNARTFSPLISVGATDAQLKRDVETERVAIEQTLISWQTTLISLTAASNPASYISGAKTNLDQIKSFLDKIALMVNSWVSSPTLSQTTLDGYRADIVTARTNINTAISNVTAAEEKLRSAESSLNLENEQLALLLAGTRPEQITAQEATVENYRAQLAKTVISAPMAGIVTRQDAKIGEIASANSAVVSLISESNFEMEANIPEADIAKVSVGNKADVTLDAYGGDTVFKAEVSKIDPAETVIEGVATYKTTLQFESKDSRIKSGMTANIEIETAKAARAVSVPQRAVISKDSKKFIKILRNDGSVSETEIATGLTGSDGNVEILSGVKEGDKIITFSGE